MYGGQWVIGLLYVGGWEVPPAICGEMEGLDIVMKLPQTAVGR